jgi:hypothetical protein
MPKYDADASTMPTRSGSPSLNTVLLSSSSTDRASTDFSSSRHARKFADDTTFFGFSLRASQIDTSRSPFPYGNGSSSTPFTTANASVVAEIAMATVNTIAAENAGRRRRNRSA